MDDLETTLRKIVGGLEKPSFRDVAKIAQELTIKQMRQSFGQRQTPDEDPWPATKRPSFAGVLKSTHRHLLDERARGSNPWTYYGRDVLRHSESFLSLRAYSVIARGEATDGGFVARGTLQSYAFWQNDGTSRTGWGPPIPAREFWGFGSDLLDLVQSLLADRAAAVVAGE